MNTDPVFTFLCIEVGHDGIPGGHHCLLPPEAAQPHPEVPCGAPQRGEKLNRVRMVEKTALEGVKNTAVEFLTLEDDIFKQKSQLCQYYVHDFQKRVANKEEEKQRIQDDTK
ncbi:unnamed protein product [Oncorhynchus mykiss]|uniref:Uncharacterized protein n=1 Tax=Oncorhynchus mykiss TaxID=8022 RepID=A0A060XNS6_ONCMY|nr:unnamed protein product [Oncorhynchus mykiss]